jgi:hypothetical protein
MLIFVPLYCTETFFEVMVILSHQVVVIKD